MVRRTSIGFAYSQHQHSSVRYRKQPFRWYVEPSLFGDDDRLELEGTINRLSTLQSEEGEDEIGSDYDPSPESEADEADDDDVAGSFANERRRWSKAAYELLESLCEHLHTEDTFRWDDIGLAMGRSPEACHRHWRRLGNSMDPRKPHKIFTRGPWTPSEDGKLAKIKSADDGVPWKEVADQLRRTVESCECRWRHTLQWKVRRERYEADCNQLEQDERELENRAAHLGGKKRERQGTDDPVGRDAADLNGASQLECPGVADGDAPPDEKPLLDAVRGDTPNPTPVVDIADLEADLELLERTVKGLEKKRRLEEKVQQLLSPQKSVQVKVEE